MNSTCAVASNQIRLYHDVTVNDCKNLCDSHRLCLGFQYGVVHQDVVEGEGVGAGVGGTVHYAPLSCHLSSTVSSICHQGVVGQG